jgi:hypothetical protein
MPCRIHFLECALFLFLFCFVLPCFAVFCFILLCFALLCFALFCFCVPTLRAVRGHASTDSLCLKFSLDVKVGPTSLWLDLHGEFTAKQNMSIATRLSAQSGVKGSLRKRRLDLWGRCARAI